MCSSYNDKNTQTIIVYAPEFYLIAFSFGNDLIKLSVSILTFAKLIFTIFISFFITLIYTLLKL